MGEGTKARRHEGTKGWIGRMGGEGMTLVEVLAVVVILGLIAATFAATFSGAFGKSKRELAKSGIGIVISKLETYRMEYSKWPDEQLGLAALSDGHAVPTAAYYLSQDQMLDPWNNNYQVIIPGPDGHPYEVISFGADGVPGGEGEDADLTSVNLRERK